MKPYYIALLSAYIAGLTGYALAGVGQPVFCNPNDNYDWHLPAYQLGMIVIPAMLGWLIGYNKEKAHDEHTY